ncbi:hypothetical protein SDC9_92678 [bioreactor metagenome]|uniref:Transposase n=1 Tax=bioreactor metagenome TaxID=1076179 RepID=A0A645A8C0_9ZZZZ
MKRYSAEFKEALIRKMMPPENVPILRLAEESGVSYVTLAKWREEVRSGGEAAPGNGEQPDRWSSEDKFLIVLETGVCQPTCRFSGLKVSRALSSFSGLSHTTFSSSRFLTGRVFHRSGYFRFASSNTCFLAAGGADFFCLHALVERLVLRK